MARTWMYTCKLDKDPCKFFDIKHCEQRDSKGVCMSTEKQCEYTKFYLQRVYTAKWRKGRN